MKDVCVIGLGYIGLPTAAILAVNGYSVLGVDVREEIVETVKSGETHIVEPELGAMVRAVVTSGKLVASRQVAIADVFFICVPTPFAEDHKPDLTHVISAAESITPHLRKGNLVILESTSPVGTTENLVGKILERGGMKAGEDFYLAHAPERVLPGRILSEAIETDRIIGGLNKKSAEICRDFYATFVKGNIYVTDSKTAELTKLAENSFRDVNIAYANELASISAVLGIDVWEVIALANRHPRVRILNPGPGVGGHCIAVDPWFIVDSVPQHARLIRTAREINDSRPAAVVDEIKSYARTLKDPTIGCLGVSYKANVPDLRESPALEIVRRLQNSSIGQIIVNDPYVDAHEAGLEFTPIKDLLSRSDILVLLVDHKEYRSLDREALRSKILVDTRGTFRQ